MVDHARARDDCTTRLPRIDTVAIDTRVTLFAVMLCAVITLLCGIAPSLAGSAFPRSTHFASARFWRDSAAVRSVIVSCQVALAVVLLGRGLARGNGRPSHSQPVGFDARPACRRRRAATACALDRHAPPHAGPQRAARAHTRDAWRRVGGHDGIAAIRHQLRGSNSIEVSGRPGESLSAQRHIVSEGFFSTMGMRMVRGREFSVADAARQILNPALPGQESPDSWAWPSSRRSSSDGISAATRTASGSASIGCGSM